MRYKMERIKEIFIKIKEGHRLWVKGDNVYKTRLEKAFEPFFIELETLGVTRYFSEALLFYGKEFVDSFGDSSTGLDRAGLPVVATIDDVEKIFNAKSRDMTDKEVREFNLAKKSDVLIYRSMPMKGDRVGIEKLV